MPSFTLFSDIWHGEFDSAAERADRYGRIVQILYLLVYRILLEPALWLLSFIFSKSFGTLTVLFKTMFVFLYDSLNHVFIIASSIFTFLFRYVAYSSYLIYAAYERYAMSKEVIFTLFCLLLLRIWFFPSSPSEGHDDEETDDDDLLPIIDDHHSHNFSACQSESEEDDDWLPQEILNEPLSEI